MASVGVVSFKEVLNGGESVYYNVIRMKESFFVWMGTEAKMNDLSVAMKNRMVN
jgi:hypothetical protein